ncbi:MAG: hypothetical protein CVT49_13340 [candidate division Zixibacteria bacterium HGW-Zixibacteria-1]|nr:MAG: hypothetical protein CVT49_13340 [candidate division Zixibacteria bacterium HGW-Zixibacteria-1]
MMKHKKLTKIVLVLVISIMVFVIIGIVIHRKRAYYYEDLFSRITPGMSKKEIVAIIGEPAYADTSGSEYDIWYYDVPSLFSEMPSCYFEKKDSVLARFWWENIDISLPIDSMRILGR